MAPTSPSMLCPSPFSTLPLYIHVQIPLGSPKPGAHHSPPPTFMLPGHGCTVCSPGMLPSCCSLIVKFPVLSVPDQLPLFSWSLSRQASSPSCCLFLLPILNFQSELFAPLLLSLYSYLWTRHFPDGDHIHCFSYKKTPLVFFPFFPLNKYLLNAFHILGVVVSDLRALTLQLWHRQALREEYHRADKYSLTSGTGGGGVEAQCWST